MTGRSNNEAGKSVGQKIGFQFPGTPAGALFCRVVQVAILDVSAPGVGTVGSKKEQDRRSAGKYLAQEMPHAELCGVDSGWIRRVIRNSGLATHGWL